MRASSACRSPVDVLAGAAVTEELDVLAIVIQRLESAQVLYMVTGSIAANYYAVPRMTRDIDIVVELTAADGDRLWHLFRRDFYIDRDTVRAAIDERGVFNLIHIERVVKVDFIVRKDSEYRRREFARRRRTTAEGLEFSVVAPEDLIISKLEWNDTKPEVAERYRQLLLSRSGGERLRMGSSMNATARALIRASVLEPDPHASPSVLRRALFVRFYGHEFDAEEQERILARLGRDV